MSDFDSRGTLYTPSVSISQDEKRERRTFREKQELVRSEGHILSLYHFKMLWTRKE